MAGREAGLTGNLDLIVIGNPEMKKLNRRYRRKNRVTDVLSFAWGEDKKVKSASAGEIYICWPQIKKQAEEYGVAEKEEFARMAIHGMLHLAGYDHATKKGEKIMSAKQEKIVKNFMK